ncbi:MAG: M23 family peptidase, partial [Cyclobacteriaceae bacterium]|nr:M23 family peptidase [Cyclobacteriaceae bacterium]
MLIIRNEENFAEKTSYNFTYAKVVLFVVLFVILIFVGSFFIVETLLAQWFDPRHAQMEAKRQLLELYSQVDSLEQSVMAKQVYINRIQYILSGDTTQDFSDFDKDVSVQTTITDKSIDPNDIVPIDSQFRKEFEDMVISPNNSSVVTELPFLFTPLDGYISQSYNI